MLSAANAVVRLRSWRFASLVILFVAVSILVASGVTDEADRAVTDAVVRANGNPAADMAVIVATTSSDLFPIYFSPMIIFSVIMIARKKTRKVGGILLLVIAISAFATAQVKGIVDRDRPAYEFKPNVGFDYKPESDVLSSFSSSFPSGHATRSAAFALVVSYIVRNRNVAGISAGALMWILPAAVAFSRIYIGAHYPTDVVAGVLFGMIIANVVSKLLRLESIGTRS